MANLNKCVLIVRVVATPTGQDVRTFQGGGKVAKVRCVLNNRRFDKTKNEWVDDPVWLDLKFFNRGETGKLADRAEKLTKSQQLLVEGHLVMEEWTDKEGQKRQKILVYADAFQLLDARQNGQHGTPPEGGYRKPPAQPAEEQQEEEIPF